MRTSTHQFVPMALIALALAAGAVFFTLANPGFQNAVQALVPAPQPAPARQAVYNPGTIGRDWQEAGSIETNGYRGNGRASLSNVALPAGFSSPKCDDGRDAVYAGAYDFKGPNATGDQVFNRRFVFDCLDAEGGIIRSIEKVFEWIGRGGPPALPPALP